MMRIDDHVPNTAHIRQFLTEAFSDEEVSTLCFDYFRDVYDDFAAGMTKGQKIQCLIEYCHRREIILNLLAAIQKARPEQYKVRFPQIPVQSEVPELERDFKQAFISHAHVDTGFAHRLATDLQRSGWRTWIAPDSLKPGEKWIDAINRGLLESGVFILVLTPAAVESEWVKDETNAAIQLKRQGQLRFIPLYVKNCSIPPLWSVYQHISFTGNYANCLKRLLDELEQTSPSSQAKESLVPPKRESPLGPKMLNGPPMPLAEAESKLTVKCPNCGWSFDMITEAIVAAITQAETNRAHYGIQHCQRCQWLIRIPLEDLRQSLGV